MRQQGRSIYKDLDRDTFSDFLDTLLDQDNFNFYKEVDGRALISPCEFELRKEAVKLCKEQSYGIQAALWAALKDNEHRYETLASIRGYSKHRRLVSQARYAGFDEKDSRFGKKHVRVLQEEARRQKRRQPSQDLLPSRSRLRHQLLHRK